MQAVADAIIQLKDAILTLQPTKSWFDYITLLGGVIAAVGVIYTIYKMRKELIHQNEMLIEAQNQKDRENIINKLNFFFGPLKALRAESKTLYDLFALTEKQEADEKGKKRFRTLRHLSQGKTFSKQDTVILNEIIEVGIKQLELIEKEGQIVDNAELAGLLGKLGAHIRLIQEAAKDKQLSGYSERLEDLVFPKEVDGALESEARKLQDQYKELKNQGFKPKDHVKLSEIQLQTVSWYNSNAQKYFRTTAHLDITHLYDSFLPNFSMGDIILDAGCGVGRDTRHFIREGFRVVSFDASIELGKICNQYPFAYCLHKSFSDIDFIEEFDGVWACASLIHLDPKEFCDALSKLYRALKSGGTIFISLKEKDNNSTAQQRKTYYHEEKIVKKILAKELMLQELCVWPTEGAMQDEISNWINYLYRKP